MLQSGQRFGASCFHRMTTLKARGENISNNLIHNLVDLTDDGVTSNNGGGNTLTNNDIQVEDEAFLQEAFFYIIDDNLYAKMPKVALPLDTGLYPF